MIGDNEDTDDDNDGWTDDLEIELGYDPLDSNQYPVDTDEDGIDNNIDDDDDGDGFKDTLEDSCGSDPLESDSIPADFDDDGMCDVLDIDDDNDGAADTMDAFPFNAIEYSDLDEDGIGDNSDDDDDGDGWTDYQESKCFSNPQDSNSLPSDSDNDGICDEMESAESSGLPGLGLISTVCMITIAAFARRK